MKADDLFYKVAKVILVLTFVREINFFFSFQFVTVADVI